MGSTRSTRRPYPPASPPQLAQLLLRMKMRLLRRHQQLPVRLRLSEVFLMSTGTIFTNNRTQNIRIPADMRFPAGVKTVEVRAVGRELIISPRIGI
eukprot:gene3523-4029_t